MVILATRQRSHGLEVLVAPVTSQPPRPGTPTIEMPQRVRAHLGLGDGRSWIVADELNSFIWPGPDVRPVRGAADISPFLGKIPSRLYEQVRAKLAEIAREGRLKMTRRTE